MRFKIPNLHILPPKTLKPLIPTSHMASLLATQQTFSYTPPLCCLTGESSIERTWAQWLKLGRPKLIVAPMVDNSELLFRMICHKYGADSAYTPMLHSRIFIESEKYREQEFTTCKEDRSLFVQFCANDPEVLLEAVKKVETHCDYVNINLGRGNYEAFLMDNLPLIKSLVENLDTIKYARMLEDAGCSLLAVHGQTRDKKDQKKVWANLDTIRAVKNALIIHVLANGNIKHMDDVCDCLEATSADEVLSADRKDEKLDQADLLVECLKLCEQYPVPWQMILAHVHKMLGEWFRIHPHIREDLNAQNILTFGFLYDIVDRLRELGAGVPLYL
ncbi:tRNA-dihydrouridine(16/17) synthase [NAD(P)(+)]-like [Pyrus ussuriensis x Pyrus communis]|uniref:tRNA-dihydrouridine(16/17) synthase [NAD(P)(+)]-like n=1 Tax=Pyrus ussuriensis x Pyrus communis TaxID=2448454 RepID=A0A5N5HFV0_9ROSA|nr:tRNA-dihydrouridine(16/17) synthase [NAD(P)(+)]-like [Pyrus ussuriensis x Pyrus communis]